jgi:AraC family transcriptional regulator
MKTVNDTAELESSPSAPGKLTTPDEWAQRLSGPADLSSNRETWPTAILRHWTATSPTMDQPPLDHFYVVQHLGGAKHVERRRDGSPIFTVVESGSLTIIPMGTQFKWHTQGPIEFAHLYISPPLLTRTAARFDRVSELSLIDRVGCRDGLMEALFRAMLEEIRHPRPATTLYLDSLLEPFLLKLLLDHSTARLRRPKPRETLASFRLKRVIDFIESHLAQGLSLEDLASAAGASTFHFSRAFKNALGDTPYQYVLRRRMERAKGLLMTTDLPLASIAGSCGFRDAVQFSRSFARIVGITPTRYRSG